MDEAHGFSEMDRIGELVDVDECEIERLFRVKLGQRLGCRPHDSFDPVLQSGEFKVLPSDLTEQGSPKTMEYRNRS